jgi:serine/threonine protein kinase
MFHPISNVLTTMAQSLLSGLGKTLGIFPNSPTTNETQQIIKDLANDINRSLCRNYEGTRFLPDDKCRHFTEEDKIRSVLGIHQSTRTKEDLVRFVLNNAPRLFLILVAMKSKALEQELRYFQEQNFDDAVFPIGLDDRTDEAYALQGKLKGNRYRLLDGWEYEQRDLFENYQWRFTAPVFGTDKFNRQLHTQQVLPILEIAPRPASSGYFGEVTETVMHAEHIDSTAKLPTFKWPPTNLDQEGDAVQIKAIAIAVKRVKEGDDDRKYNRAIFFDKEVSNLYKLKETLRNHRSPNLITPIAAYRSGPSRCLLFPWADGGNLAGYWDEYSLQARNRNDVLWQIHQFVGLCDALALLHKVNVRHGDLKPENILWFDRTNNGGTLQIADLGLSTFHEKEANTMNRKGMPTQTPSGTSRYEPPEMDAQRDTEEARSRQYDIWSLGCVVLELLLWLAFSPSDITTFRNNTDYFWQKGRKRGSGRYTVHEYVVGVMDALDTHFEPGTAYRDLLGLVRDRLLVVNVSADYESVTTDCREIATKVHERFATIHRQCTSNKTYLRPLVERLQYPHSELDGRVSPRNGFDYNEVHELGGRLAVPGQGLGPRPSLSQIHTLVETSNPGSPDILTPESPEGFSFGIRRPTGDQDVESSNSQTSGASNHQEVCSPQALLSKNISLTQ